MMQQVAGGFMARRAATRVSHFRLTGKSTTTFHSLPLSLSHTLAFIRCRIDLFVLGEFLTRLKRSGFNSGGGGGGVFGRTTSFDGSVELSSRFSMVLASRMYSTSGAGNPSEVVKELYGKVLDSVKVKRSAPPNAWLWSMIEKCQNKDDIGLLFNALQQLRVFRLSNLRIHENFNCHLCQEVAKACARVGAIDFGKKAIWKHNVYGLSPSVASANHLLTYAKIHKNTDLMVTIMKSIKTNDLPLQPATADIVFRICSDADNWDLTSKYSKRFLKAGVKLRKTTFDTWMEFAVKRGDTQSLWEIENLRSKLFEAHSLKSGFSCAKGFLLERKPDNAAAMIQVLDQTLPVEKQKEVVAELQKLVGDWPSEVVKRPKEEDQKALDAALRADIQAMMNYLLNLGMAVNKEWMA